MSARVRPCTPGFINGRWAKAEQFMQAAQMIEESVENELDLTDAYITLVVHAGIAATDVICCYRLGEYSSGESHNQAIELVKKVDTKLAADLSNLLQVKTLAGYGNDPATLDNRRRAKRSAEHLMEQARQIRAGR